MIEIKNLYKTYNPGKSNEVLALRNVNFTIQKGDLIAVIGKSGSGKSTLLHLIALIDHFQKGDIIWNGKSIKQFSDSRLAKMRNQEVGLVLQDFALIPEYTVIENVMLPLFFTHSSYKQKKELALVALKKTNLCDLAYKQATELSGGQKQRVAISRAIVNSPSLLLADEPTGALDSNTSEEIINLFLDINSSGTTVVIITHDNQVANCCRKIIQISDGQLQPID